MPNTLHSYFEKKPKGQPCSSPDTGSSERERDSQSSVSIKGEPEDCTVKKEINDAVPGTSASPQQKDEISEPEDGTVKKEINDAVPGTSASPQQKDEISEPEDRTVKEEINDAVPGTSASPQQKDKISFLEETTENFIKLIHDFIMEMKKLKAENTQLKKKNQALEEKIKVMKLHVVTPTKNTKLKNMFIIVKLNNEKCLYHYCAICRQKISCEKRLRQLKVKHPQCEVILRSYCPNSINFLNLIKEFGKNIKMKAEMKGKLSKCENKYFSLCGGYTERDFLEDVKKRLNPS